MLICTATNTAVVTRAPTAIIAKTYLGFGIWTSVPFGGVAKREYLRLPSDFAFSLEREAILLPEYQVTCFGESPVIFPINVAELIHIS